MVFSQTETIYSREIKITTMATFGQSEDLSGITIAPLFCGCIREKNTHLELLDDGTDTIYSGR